MIYFFGDPSHKVYALEKQSELSDLDTEKLTWLFGNQPLIRTASVDAFFVGPRAAMVTPWSTNATEISQNMGISGIRRIEEFNAVKEGFKEYDPMLFQKYKGLTQEIFTISVEVEPIQPVLDIGHSVFIVFDS